MEEVRLPVPIQTMMILAPTGIIYYPQLQWPKNLVIQNKLNKGLLSKVNKLFNKSYQQIYITELVGDYEVKNNQRGIISINLNNFATGPKLAHPIDNLSSINADIRTGKIYTLSDLFNQNSDYLKRLSALVKDQINKRNMNTLQPFDTIRPNQDFYLADKSLVIYFQRYEITPRPAGYPMFPISIYDIIDIIDKNGPLGKMLADF
ncbi:hypothetical protein WQ54_11800 [Bacillus sp. SA1-12]|uniref:DUF3298 and DUF4163 domain-containing protein n=1 Tax=Bacillus sp. SA1-12 TaxID=1455638 RepID=UPI0006264ECA|nr:DUF3298 and DUF4163 domain-containing protein [Bacillus sp. SA1-12]KKI91971.1 hypothetical protein WQ54_11800 [Bacillus sp. SA1-12]